MNTLNISKKTISYNHQIIQTSNISTINLLETFPVKRSRGIINFLLFIGIIELVASIFNFWNNGGNFLEDIFLLNLSIGVILIAISHFINKYESKSVIKRKRFILKILTNAGGVELFKHRDYDFINGIRLKIQEVLGSDHAPSITYNLDNKTIINNPTGDINFINTTIYEGLSPEQIDFLSSKFEDALQQVKKEIETESDKGIKETLIY